MVQHRPSPSSVRVALVTGANRGIGFEVCRQLAEKDFVVLLTARDAAKAKAAADKLKIAGVIEPVVLDVGDATSIKHAAAEVEGRYGCLDVHHAQEYNRVNARLQSGLLFLATVALIMPSAASKLDSVGGSPRS